MEYGARRAEGFVGATVRRTYGAGPVCCFRGRGRRRFGASAAETRERCRACGCPHRCDLACPPAAPPPSTLSPRHCLNLTPALPPSLSVSLRSGRSAAPCRRPAACCTCCCCTCCCCTCCCCTCCCCTCCCCTVSAPCSPVHSPPHTPYSWSAKARPNPPAHSQLERDVDPSFSSY
jgi:hypothetical protein